MKLSSSLGLLIDLRYAIQSAFLPTLRTVWQNPTLILDPQGLSREFMSHVWAVYGSAVDEGGREVKQGLLPKNAQGVVLDVGAGKF